MDRMERNGENCGMDKILPDLLSQYSKDYVLDPRHLFAVLCLQKMTKRQIAIAKSDLKKGADEFAWMDPYRYHSFNNKQIKLNHSGSHNSSEHKND